MKQINSVNLTLKLKAYKYLIEKYYKYYESLLNRNDSSITYRLRVEFTAAEELYSYLFDLSDDLREKLIDKLYTKAKIRYKKEHKHTKK